MKFGQEYKHALESEDFPEEWKQSAIEYKHLKKIINKIHKELKAIGLDADTLRHLGEWVDQPEVEQDGGDASQEGAVSLQPDAAHITEELTPRLWVLVDSKSGEPLDAALAPETKKYLQKIARHGAVAAGRREHVGASIRSPSPTRRKSGYANGTAETDGPSEVPEGARWIQVPLASAKDFFDLLEPKLQELEALRAAETTKLEDEILDLGDAVEDVVEPVRDGFEAVRRVSYRDLYFWREMFRLYLETPIFYSENGTRRGALTFKEAKERLEAFDEHLRSTGLLAKMKTPQAQKAAKQFLDLNVEILKIMHFQEMNARAMTKILKKFDKRTHLEGQMFLQNLNAKYPSLLINDKNGRSAGGFANSIARDLQAELASKVLAIVPQLHDWTCPVCYGMAWQPVNLGCCRSVFCIRCIIRLQGEGVKKCPVCDRETIMQANGRNIDFETMDFMEKYFPLEAKRRQMEIDKEKENLIEDDHEESAKHRCAMQ